MCPLRRQLICKVKAGAGRVIINLELISTLALNDSEEVLVVLNKKAPS